MSFLRKIWADKFTLLIVSLFIVGAFLRLYNFQSRLIFGPEQAISLLTSGSYLEKFSLLGEVNVQRVTSQGHNPFHGAYFNYFLVPFMLLFRFQPLPITYLFVLLNLLTAYVFYLVTKNIFGKTIGVFTLFYFLLNDKMIHHSLFIWNLNFLPLLGILTLWAVVSLAKDCQNLYYPFWLGLIGGIGFGLQYLFFPFILLTFLLTIIFSKQKTKTILVFILGGVLGALSMVIFDLRHDFYYTRTLWQYFLDVRNHRISGSTHYYDFMYLLPYLFLFWGIFTAFIYKLYKPLIIFPLAICLYLTFTSPTINLTSSTGMPQGLTLASLEKAASVIASDSPPARFNVATLWDFDTRSHPLRYLLTYYYQLKPMPVEEYTHLDALYVFAPESYELEHPQVWELQTFLPYRITNLGLDQPGYRLYKLTK